MRIRMRLRLSLFATTAAVLLPCLAPATDYYINSSGKDSNACTSAAAPCLTLAHAESLSAPGDTFHISGVNRLSAPIAAKSNQVFIGMSTCNALAAACPSVLSGGVPLCGQSHPCSGPDAHGNWSVPNMPQNGPQAPVADCDSGWSGCIYPEDLFVDGLPLRHVNSATLPALAAATWWFDYARHVIYFHQNPTGHSVELSSTSTVFQPNCANGVTIQNLTVREFAAQLGQGGGIDSHYGLNATPACGANWIIHNSYITLNHSAGIRVGFGMRITSSQIVRNGDIGISGGLPAGNNITPSGLLIQGNTITLNNYAHAAPGWQAGGIKLGNTAYPVIHGNHIHHDNGQGIHLDDNSYGGLIEDNIVEYEADLAGSGSASAGIAIEISNGEFTVRNNTVRFNGAGTTQGPNNQIVSANSSGVNCYCNVIEVDNGPVNHSWIVFASPRGNNAAPPMQGQPVISIGNWFHHNTVIFDGPTGSAGYMQGDIGRQPKFFSVNHTPDFNMYHAANTTVPRFMYDNDNSGRNAAKTFQQYQSSGADVNGTVDTVYQKGYPNVLFSAASDPSDSGSTVQVAASDPSGIASSTLLMDWAASGQLITGSGPFAFAIPPALKGQHVLAVMVTAKSGVKVCKALTVNVGHVPAS